MTQIAIVLFPQVTALDAIGPYEVLTRIPDADVELVALEPGPQQTEGGPLALVAGRALEEVPSPDVVVMPGGFGSRALMDDERMLSWLRSAHESSRYTTSVCTGALVLAAAGLLDGVDATTHWAFRATLAELGAHPVEERVVERGKIMTAAGVSAGIDMALALTAKLAGEPVARAIQLGIEYDPQPPFDCGSPSKAEPELVELVRTLA